MPFCDWASDLCCSLLVDLLFSLLDFFLGCLEHLCYLVEDLLWLVNFWNIKVLCNIHASVSSRAEVKLKIKQGLEKDF